MPWSGSEFAEKHNQRLKGKQAEKAAAMASALLREGHDEASAIKITNAHFRPKYEKMYKSKS